MTTSTAPNVATPPSNTGITSTIFMMVTSIILTVIISMSTNSAWTRLTPRRVRPGIAVQGMSLVMCMDPAVVMRRSPMAITSTISWMGTFITLMVITVIIMGLSASCGKERVFTAIRSR